MKSLVAKRETLHSANTVSLQEVIAKTVNNLNPRRPRVSPVHINDLGQKVGQQFFVEGDEERLQQIVHKLLCFHASSFCVEEKRRVMVSIHFVRRASDEHCLPPSTRMENFVAFTVHNSCCSFNHDSCAHAHCRSVMSNSIETISKLVTKLVEESNGYFSVKTKNGEGAAFTVYLPNASLRTIH